MGTVLVGMILVAVVAVIVVSLVKNKKNGKSFCDGNCSACHSACNSKNSF